MGTGRDRRGLRADLGGGRGRRGLDDPDTGRLMGGTHFRLRWERRGDHIHARLFVADQESMTHAKSGDLCFTLAEWESFLRCFQDRGRDRIVVVPEDDA